MVIIWGLNNKIRKLRIRIENWKIELRNKSKRKDWRNCRIVIKKINKKDRTKKDRFRKRSNNKNNRNKL